MSTVDGDRELRQVVDLVAVNVDDCIERLERIETTQHFHGGMLASHGEMLASHGKILASHGEMLEIHGQRLGRIEGRLDNIESRMKVLVDWVNIASSQFDSLAKQNDLTLEVLGKQSKQIDLLASTLSR